MGETITMVMKRFAERKKEIEQNPEASEKDLRCLPIVDKFLKDPRGLAFAEPLMSIATLKFLGYSDKEINDIYFKIIFEVTTGAEYKYVDPDSFEDK